MCNYLEVAKIWLCSLKVSCKIFLKQMCFCGTFQGLGLIPAMSPGAIHCSYRALMTYFFID